MLAILTGAIVAAGVPATASAFDSAQESANYTKPFERPRLEPASNPLGAPALSVHFSNRNGALLSGHLWLPPKGTDRGGRLPTVVFVNGDIAPETVYWFAAAAFANAGYLVLTYDPQGHGASDVLGSGADALRNVLVQQGAEGGAVEAQADADAVEQADDALAFLYSTPAHPYAPARIDGKPSDPHDPTPGQQRQAQAVAAGSANDANPLHTRVDTNRVGVVGHSRGADVASILAATDTRLRAAVAWDDLLGHTSDDPPVPLRAKVPVLGIADDYYQVPQPFTADPDPQQHSTGFAAARAAGVDAAELVLRGATHFEFSYQAGIALPATLRGVDFATWYATAWLDRYVKGDAGAVKRLLTGRWRSDAAEAAVDASADGNLFSFYFRSRLAIHVPLPASAPKAKAKPKAKKRPKKHPKRTAKRRRARHKPHRVKRPRKPAAKPAPAALVTCDDLRVGCTTLIPAAQDGGPRRYAVLDPEPG